MGLASNEERKQNEAILVINRKSPEQNEVNTEIRHFIPTPSTSLNTMQKVKPRDALYQIFASCIIHCIVIQVGVNMAYSTVLTRGLELDGYMKANDDQISWIASLVTISLPIGSLIAGPLMDKFGRKAVCLLSCTPSMLSWILLITANSITLIYIARIIAGIAGGLTTVGLVYVSEITHPQIRAMLLCLNSVYVSLGILITCCLAVVFEWQRMAIVFFILNICVFLALFFVPESPYWLICFDNGILDQERIRKAEYSLQWLNGEKTIYEQEYSRIKEICHNRKTSEESVKSTTKQIINYYKILKTPSGYKPVVILFFLLLMQQLSGCYVVIFYAISVFHEIGGTFGEGLGENGALVMLGVIRFVMSILTVFLSKKYGRRILCICSGLGMSFSMFFSGMYMYLTSSCDEHGNVREIMAEQKWVLLIIVLFYVCMSSLGLIIIPWTLIGELLPMSIRGIGGGLMVAVGYLLMSAVIKGYPYALKAMSMQSMFFFFSFVSLVCTSFIYLFLPETLGRSFSEIESYFNNNSSRNHKTFKTNIIS